MKLSSAAPGGQAADIVIFAASETFAQTARELILERRLENHIAVTEATGERTLKLALQFAREGSRVFISRGRNTKLIERHVSVPVINVPYLCEEIYSSFLAAGAPPERVAMVGFDRAYNIMKTFRRISGLDVQLIEPQSPGTVIKELREKLRPGTEALIGGFSVKRAISEIQDLGLRHIPLTVEPSNISLAIDSALNILASMDRKDEFLTTISTTINRISNAVMNFDTNGKLLFSNARADHMPQSVKKYLFTGEAAFYLDLDGRTPADSRTAPKKEQILHVGDDTYVAEYLPVIVNKRLKSIVVIVSSENSIQMAEKRLRLSQSKRGYTAKNHFHDMIGNSPVFQETIQLAKKYARSQSSVLITGETGTGKELFAQSIHNASSRCSEPFVAINCAALPQSLLESELFGYVKGAFTGASKEGKMGIFEMAHRGTVFLDEIGEMDLNVQAKLLRVLQEREVCRLGDDKIIPVDIRIISATNKDLEELVRQELFREDLLYRLNVLELRLPPLRERTGDIPLLIKAYNGKQNHPVTFLPEAVRLLEAQPYPGNIRQLFNLLERTITLSDGDMIEASQLANILHLPFSSASPNCGSPDCGSKEPAFPDPASEASSSGCSVSSLDSAMDLCEKERILETLRKNRGRRKETAEQLNISPATLWRKMKKYDIF